MSKSAMETAFIDAMVLSLECQMCGTTMSDADLDGEDLATKAWHLGWRVQDWQIDGQSGADAVLCQHCTDGKR